MTPGPMATGKGNNRLLGRWIGACAFIAGAILVATSSTAQSLYGCENLSEELTGAYEGSDGVFFRLDPDLTMYHRPTGAVIDTIGQLSENLEARGTRLVVLPIPTKALAMPQHLGTGFQAYGYDPAIAAAIYDETIRRMNRVGIRVIDARRVLLGAQTDGNAFFGTDRRLAEPGLTLLARAAANAAGPKGPVEFETRYGETIELPSRDWLFLQMKCQASLPHPETRQSTTERLSGGDPAPTVVTIGTELTGDPASNFVGLIAYFAGRDAIGYMSESDSLSALSAYLTSDAFQQSPPEILVWEFPIWSNLAIRGDQPLGEIVAAASGICGPELELQPSGTGVRADIETFPKEDDLVLLVNARDGNLTRVDYTFTNASGDSAEREVIRADTEFATPRIYLPLSGLGEDALISVELVIEPAQSSPPVVALCRGGTG